MDALNFLTHISNYWKVPKDETTSFKNVKYSKNGWIALMKTFFRLIF